MHSTATGPGDVAKIRARFPDHVKGAAVLSSCLWFLALWAYLAVESAFGGSSAFGLLFAIVLGTTALIQIVGAVWTKPTALALSSLLLAVFETSMIGRITGGMNSSGYIAEWAALLPFLLLRAVIIRGSIKHTA